MPGPKSHHKLTHKNPNPGEGCLCSPNGKEQDCRPPYIVFTHAEVISGRNPHAVVSAACLDTAVGKCVRGGGFKSELAAPAAPDSEPITVSDALVQATTRELIDALSRTERL